MNVRNHAAAAARILMGVCIPIYACCGCGAEHAGAAVTSTGQPYSIRFAAKVGDRSFSCTETYDHIGMGDSTIQPLDFRLYVRDIALIRGNGEKVTLLLDQDRKWQRDTVAFVDFEDNTGTCRTGSPETHTTVTGTAPVHDDYSAIEFIVGIPHEENHLNGATAPAPFNVPGMWWSWSGGYKFVRLDVSTPQNPAFYFHLGETSCKGSVSTGFQCDVTNQAVIHLDGFDAHHHEITVDLASFYADSNLDLTVDKTKDSVSGCMAFAGDPECPVLMGRLGLTVVPPGTPTTSAPESRLSPQQTFFRLEEVKQ